MKFLLPILFVFISFVSKAQSAQDQQVFNNQVWKKVLISNVETSFFDSNDVFLGSKLDTKAKTIYRDKWKRTIKVFTKEEVLVKKQAPKVKREQKGGKSRFSNQVIVRRNKATYFNESGAVIRTAKRRGKKVYFHNKSGKLIGYKIYNSDGSKTYKDSRGRVTGRSYIDKTGRMIYRAKNRKRRTARVLFEDPFLYS